MIQNPVSFTCDIAVAPAAIEIVISANKEGDNDKAFTTGAIRPAAVNIATVAEP